MAELEPCPFGADHKVWIAVHDDEGNYKGEPGCDYESGPWSGLSYGLHHEGWGTCPLCTDDEWEAMGGMLFDTPEEAAQAWNARWERTCRITDEEPIEIPDQDPWYGMLDTGIARYKLSCGHSTLSGEDNGPKRCPECGAKVVDQ